ETMFKRLWWQGYNGRFVAFRWATQTSATSYNTSEWFAWKYGKSLLNYVDNYLKHQMPDYTMSIAAHSMGNVVVGSALKRGLSIDEYILMEAAIPSGCYNDSVNNYSRSRCNTLMGWRLPLIYTHRYSAPFLAQIQPQHFPYCAQRCSSCNRASDVLDSYPHNLRAICH